ncbi:MAG: hypothetical protein WDW36_002861 [Sanguina aurantia]
MPVFYGCQAAASIGEELLSAVKQAQGRLLVLATHGHASACVVGSVVHHLLSHSHVPLLLVPPPPRHHQAPPHGVGADHSTTPLAAAAAGQLEEGRQSVATPPEPVAPAGHALPTQTTQPVDSPSAKAGGVTGVGREGAQGDSDSCDSDPSDSDPSESGVGQDEEGAQSSWQALAEAVGGVGSGLGQLAQSQEAEVQRDGRVRSGADAAAAAGAGAGTAAVTTAVSAAGTAAEAEAVAEGTSGTAGAAGTAGTAGTAGAALAATPPADGVVALDLPALPVVARGADAGAAAVAAGVGSAGF